MIKTGSILMLVGSVLGAIASLLTFFVGGFATTFGIDQNLWVFALLGLPLSITIFMMSIVSFSKKTNSIGIMVLILSIASLIGGGPLVFIPAIISLVGAIVAIFGAGQYAKDNEAVRITNPTSGIIYKQWWFWLCIIVLVCVSLFTAQYADKITNGKNLTGESSSAEVYDTLAVSSPDEMIQAYSDNEISAESVYKNKYIEMTGIINSINSTSETSFSIYFKLDNAMFTSFYCTFDGEENIEKVKSLNKGDKISVVGLFEGQDFMGSFVLKKSSFVD